MGDFQTLRFPNTPEGQRQKVERLAAESAQGWRVVSETIEQGDFKGKKACCLFVICAPLAFLAGREDSVICLTLEREQVKREQAKKCPYCAEVIKLEAIVCRYCGKDFPAKKIHDTGTKETFSTTKSTESNKYSGIVVGSINKNIEKDMQSKTHDKTWDEHFRNEKERILLEVECLPQDFIINCPMCDIKIPGDAIICPLCKFMVPENLRKQRPIGLVSPPASSNEPETD